MEKISRFGVDDRRGYYFLETIDGSVVRFSNDGVDGSDFSGWPPVRLDTFHLMVSAGGGKVYLHAWRGNQIVMVPLGTAPPSERLQVWIAAVNARLPKP